jgi:hypothetical protein
MEKFDLEKLVATCYRIGHFKVYLILFYSHFCGDERSLKKTPE